MRTAALLVAICCCFPSSHASDANQRYSIRGAAIIGCGDYLREQEMQSAAYQAIRGWLDGYITGVNQYAPDTYDSLSFESTELIARVLQHHCTSHPDHRVFSVINSLLKTMHGDRIRAISPRVKVKVGNQETTLYAEVLERMQRKLAALGHYQGELESEFGTRTQTAVAAFQSASKAEPTGFPDQGTLWNLLKRPDGGR